MKKIANWIIGLISLLFGALIYGLFTSKDNFEMKKALDDVDKREDKIKRQQEVDERVLNELYDVEREQEQLRKDNNKKVKKAGEDIETKEFSDPDNAVDSINDDLADYDSK